MAKNSTPRRKAPRYKTRKQRRALWWVRMAKERAGSGQHEQAIECYEQACKRWPQRGRTEWEPRIAELRIAAARETRPPRPTRCAGNAELQQLLDPLGPDDREFLDLSEHGADREFARSAWQGGASSYVRAMKARAGTNWAFSMMRESAAAAAVKASKQHAVAPLLRERRERADTEAHWREELRPKIEGLHKDRRSHQNIANIVTREMKETAAKLRQEDKAGHRVEWLERGIGRNGVAKLLRGASPPRT